MRLSANNYCFSKNIMTKISLKYPELLYANSKATGYINGTLKLSDIQCKALMAKTLPTVKDERFCFEVEFFINVESGGDTITFVASIPESSKEFCSDDQLSALEEVANCWSGDVCVGERIVQLPSEPRFDDVYYHGPETLDRKRKRIFEFNPLMTVSECRHLLAKLNMYFDEILAGKREYIHVEMSHPHDGELKPAYMYIKFEEGVCEVFPTIKFWGESKKPVYVEVDVTGKRLRIADTRREVSQSPWHEIKYGVVSFLKKREGVCNDND